LYFFSAYLCHKNLLINYLVLTVQEKQPGDLQKYNAMIHYYNIREAVLGMVTNKTGLNMPKPFQENLAKLFLQNYDFYEKFILNNIHLTGTPIQVRTCMSGPANDSCMSVKL